jgi:DNA polymerase-3 subunit gamma/tau
MRDAPDPRVLLEVALVRQCRPDADISLAALLERIERLERGQSGRGAPVSGQDEPPGAEPGTRPADGARAALGGVRAATPPPPDSAPPESASPDTAPPDSVSTDTAPPDSDSTESALPDTALSDTPASAAGSGGPLPTRDELTLAWGDVVLAALPQRAKVRFGAGHFVGVDDAWATFALPNTVHRDRCEECRHEVEQTLASHFGRPVPLRLVVAQPGTPPTDKPSPEPDDEIDLTELRDAPAAEVASPVDHVMQVFEGAEVVED